MSDWSFFGKSFLLCSLSDDLDSISVKAHFGYSHMYVTNFKNLHAYTLPY